MSGAVDILTVRMCALIHLFVVFACLSILLPSVFGISAFRTLPNHEVATRILEAMNTDVEPCDDFYEFACGRWIQRNPIPKGETSWSQTAKLQNEIYIAIRELLEDDSEEGLSTSVAKAKSFYRACVDTEKIEKDGIKPIQQALEKMGLPPLPPAEGSANFSWEEAAGNSRRYLDLHILLSLHMTPDNGNRSRNRIKIGKPTLNIINNDLLEPEQFAKDLDHEYITSMIEIADPTIDAEKFADDIIAFSTSLAEIKLHDKDTRNREFSVTQFLDGPTEGPGAWKEHDWARYLELVFANTSVTLDPDLDTIAVMDLPYLQKLATLLSETEPVKIERFLWWTVFSTLAPLTLHSFEELKCVFSRGAIKQRVCGPRWETCIYYVKGKMNLVLDYLYVKNHFDPASIEKVTEMMENVIEDFADTVKQMDWLDPTTSNTVLIKLKAMRYSVGFPSWLFTAGKLDEYYKYVDVVEGNLIESELKMRSAVVKKSFEYLTDSLDRTRWFFPVSMVEAGYCETENSIEIPAAILHPPFFGNEIEAIDYGAIGAVLGHEVTHGFDNNGRRYDEKGNLKEWWSNDTLKQYNEKVQCFIDQYNKYHVPESSNNTMAGVKTQGENIADNGGLRLALNAYRAYSSNVPSEAYHSIPGLAQYSPEQLFFLSFAQTWCSISTDEALKAKMERDVHSPPKIRIIGTMSNSKDFAEAWQCPSGSPMNPEHKCVLWG